MKKALLKIPVIGNLIEWYRLPKQFALYRKYLDELAIDFRAAEEEIQSEITRMNAPVNMQETFIVNKPYITADIRKKIKDEQEKQYTIFEDVFRGSEEGLKKKLEFYLEFVKKSQKADGYFLDIGCGRGEFLEILQKAKIICKGLELDESLKKDLKDKDLDVHFKDANEFLQNEGNASLGGISAIQFIEHNSSDYLKEFIRLAYEKISSGGLLIVESINPHCFLSLGHFFLDDTHLRPYSAETIKFLLEWYGFKNVEIIFRTPCPPEFRVEKYLDHNYQEYSVLGWKE
jgi:O-antigen chain-terminating methyltransferase